MTITNSSNNIGGLVGGQSEGTITGHATGAVTGTATKKQGFIGYKNGGIIQGSYFDPTATGQIDTTATCVSATANIYKFTGPTETSGRTGGEILR